MKIQTFIFLLIIGIPLQIVAQNIPNCDFEIWAYNSNGMLQPQYWETQNEPELIFVEALPGHSGKHAACLNVQWDYMLKKYSGASLKSEFDLSEEKKYRSLSGYYRGNSENNDTLLIEIDLFYGNKLIGRGVIKILENSNNWENFKIPIYYFSEALPDRASISISINPTKGNHSLSTYCIDDLLLAEAFSTKQTPFIYHESG